MSDEVLTLRPGMKCQYEGCDLPAEAVCEGRTWRGEGHGLGVYCRTHAGIVVDEGNPEYAVTCPNCGCGFGVN